MNAKRLLFVTGSRGEWGYIRPILRLCEDDERFDCSICATNMHLSPAYGSSVNEIEKDGFKVDHKIYMSLDGYNHYSQAKSLGVFLSSLADVMASSRPDWIILAGDRGEQLMGALAGAFCYVPVAHIQAGEISGNIDGMTRHAIGKYAHLHLAANQDAADRLILLGEEPFRVHNVGAPQLDEVVQGQITSRGDLEKKYDLDLSCPYILFVQHSTTEDAASASDQIGVTMEVLAEMDVPKVVIMPNNDAGSFQIRKGIENLRHGDFHCFANLKRADYLGLLKNSRAMVGNSSSGLLEAPSFNIPAVNMGGRQEGRVRGINVIDIPFEKNALRAALRQALSDTFHEKLCAECVNPYGDGLSSERILKLLFEMAVDDKLLVKKLTY